MNKGIRATIDAVDRRITSKRSACEWRTSQLAGLLNARLSLCVRLLESARVRLADAAVVSLWAADVSILFSRPMRSKVSTHDYIAKYPLKMGKPFKASSF